MLKIKALSTRYRVRAERLFDQAFLSFLFQQAVNVTLREEQETEHILHAVYF